MAVTQLDTARGERSHEWPVFSIDGRTLVFSVNATSADFDEEEVSLLTLGTGTRGTVRMVATPWASWTPESCCSCATIP